MSNVPARLTLQDLPRDKSRALGSLRQTLCATVNYCRRYPEKLELLKQTLKVAYNYVNNYQKQVAADTESRAKTELELAAKELGLDLDKRKTLEALQAEYDEFVAKSEEEQAEIVATMEARAAEAQKKAEIKDAEAKVVEAQKALEGLQATESTE